MLVIIPMSGFGERFRRAGYKVPKPLIISEGKPFVQHVHEMFDESDRFVFVCNNDHLSDPNFQMEEIIKSFCPSAIIVGIDSHKLGPVHAVQKIISDFKDEEEVIVNYCDFTCYWDYNSFKRFISNSNSIGCIPAYKGFHPHSLGKTNYAYLKEEKNIITDIKEKEPFTNDKSNEFASSGTYYFKSVKILKEALNYVVDNGIMTGGEYYISMAYKYLFKNNLKTTVYPLQHFMQWGTPQDFEEYQYYSKIFRKAIEPTKQIEIKGGLIIPMAGLGQRFRNEGYTETKPLIKVSGEPMIEQALKTLPKFSSYNFIIRKDLDNKSEIINSLEKKFKTSSFTELNDKTNGQATTIKLGLNEINNGDGSIHIVSCDNGYIMSQSNLDNLISEGCDVISWAIKDYPYSQISPNSFGWVYYDSNHRIMDVCVKEKKESNYNNAVISGGFTFKNKAIFNKCYDSLILNKNIINGEYYADSLIQEALKLNLKCKVFLIESYISWGTPTELKTYDYWQSCFHKWESHPYEIGLDQNILKSNLNILKNKIYDFNIKKV